MVKDADNLDVELELKELEAMGNKLGQALYPTRLKVVESKFYTETARQMWHEIQNSDPHHWHMSGKNRLNSGDWSEQAETEK